MKHLLILISIFTFFTAKAQEEDYIIEINRKRTTVATDKEYKILVNGKQADFILRLKDTLQYNDDIFSFKYPKDFKVSKLTLEEGIEQVMLVTAEGSGFIVQKYIGFDPSMLNEMMLSEVVKESVSYGYELERQDYKRKLASGREIEVDKAVLTYMGETNIYEVATIAGKDIGILIMTMITNDEYTQQGNTLIRMMWKTLEYK